jgi:hypothetical protein
MAKCKNCHRKGFMVETDVSGLCPACAQYYYLTLPDDLKALTQALQALSRIDKAEAAIGRLETARDCLNRLRSYAQAGLVSLPQPAVQLDLYLDQLVERWASA